MGIQGYPWRRAKAGHQTHTVRDRVELLAGRVKEERGFGEGAIFLFFF